MIIDSIKEISTYSEISDKVKEFLCGLNENTEPGRYEIDENSYANIDVYETKPIEKCRFEAHKKYIDIQMILDGAEKLDYTSIEGLTVSEAYDDGRDIMFFENPERDADTVQLTPFKFAMIFPHEAHKPQICKHSPSKVKKVVVKIKK